MRRTKLTLRCITALDAESKEDGDAGRDVHNIAATLTIRINLKCSVRIGRK